MSNRHDQDTARMGRQAAIVIACAGLLSIFAPQLTRLLGATPRVEMLFYLISLAGFIWSLVVTWKLWQKTRDK
ncbi:DUF5337 family protein [Octadecabacter ascidiaceicola]|uniref:DUF5337 family protein n=1 Tax=Octadecabacter ascidiaceicola TaxID=1655543 RepID=UPI000B8B01A7|nr:DUF5337 family protein [Octadecabacter ascidiaceicola]